LRVDFWRGGESLLFFFKIRTLQNISFNDLNEIEVLYDHLSCSSYNYFKILTIFQNIDLALQNPTKTNSQTKPLLLLPHSHIN
jgi:hypothetical protein